MLKKYWPYILLALCALLYLLFAAFPATMDKIYSAGFYWLVAQALSNISARIPFSCAELMVVLCPFFLLYCILKRRWKLILHCFITLIASYMLLCGLNYHRLPLSKHLDYSISESSVDDLVDMCRTLVLMCNKDAESVRINSRGESRADYTFEEIRKEVLKSYNRLGDDCFPQIRGSFPSVKPVILSPLMSYSGIMGIFFPFTLESNINKDVCSFWIPALIVHEQAHLRGFMREDEANFLVFLLSHYTIHPEIVYSCRLFTFQRVSAALAYANPEEWQTLVRELSPHVMADLRANSLYWQKYRSLWGEFSNTINDAYLKANRQKDGVQSYGRVVDLLLADYHKNPNHWKIPNNNQIQCIIQQNSL